ncbi:hypothetical protein [Paracoccus sp. R86501]|uniref:hypothetical protein n=1 Tax=Paracoccus sp. R86501 TaxID=3101711 RepID=UPI00366B6A9C
MIAADGICLPNAKLSGSSYRQDGSDGFLFCRHRNIPRSWCSTPRAEEDGKMKNMMIGVDLAKAVFQVHAPFDR